MYLKGKKILLAISGSIAAYKSAMLTRLFVKQGAELRVIMTQSATNFISPLTFSTLSKNSVVTQFFSSQEEVWNNHVELGLWADLMLIAPASANTLAKMANGICDNVLLATYLSAKCPVFFAPAMDLDMWLHPSTQRNLQTLNSYGNHLIEVEHGELASGLIGKGRMAEPESILNTIEEYFVNHLEKPLENQQVLITAGPTHEALDPVRFIGNRSTGRMGIALAEVAFEQGAYVRLVLGPTQLKPRYKGIEVVKVRTAQEMFEAAMQKQAEVDIAILAAAVADFTPSEVSSSKIKKKNNEDGMTLSLKRTKDILATLGENKKTHQILVGFALETNNELANAQKKLQKKNLDCIVLNSLRDKGAGFKHNTNKITILDKYNSIQKFELKSKKEAAEDILRKVLELKQKMTV
ncbi:MAG: bifunctional phosphopantothenoylcysteine decarboxylase/phosphopantothenate--cysteine ligase CoaBC [Chitinophagales bacterium]